MSKLLDKTVMNMMRRAENFIPEVGDDVSLQDEDAIVKSVDNGMVIIEFDNNETQTFRIQDLKPLGVRGGGWTISAKKTAQARPQACEEKHLIFLDELREEKLTNMYGGVSYLLDEFMISPQEAKEILLYWMDSFSQRHQ
jgi:hypothetical protein